MAKDSYAKKIESIPKHKIQEIINYCYNYLENININYLEKIDIRTNLFLEMLYDTSRNKFIEFNDYRINSDDIKNIYMYSRNLEQITKDFINGKIELQSIDNNDTFYYKIIRNINKQEI